MLTIPPFHCSLPHSPPHRTVHTHCCPAPAPALRRTGTCSPGARAHHTRPAHSPCTLVQVGRSCSRSSTHACSTNGGTQGTWHRADRVPAPHHGHGCGVS